MKQYILLLVLMVMGAGINAYAEDVNPVKEGNVISGHVVEKGTENSLPYAAILIVETGQGTVSNEDGEFRFKKVPAGKYTLRVQLLGYETQEKKVTVSNDFTVDVHFLMSDESMKTIFLMRHGETLFNVMDVNQGQCDSPLTENGINQALAAKEWFKN